MTFGATALEQVVSRIEQVNSQPNTSVKWNGKVRDPHTGRLRQIDVLIERAGALTIVECRDHSSPQDVQWIEELAGRRQSLSADEVIAVSSSGFSKPAIQKAKFLSVSLRQLDELSDDEILHWGSPVRVWIDYLEVKDVRCDCHVAGEQLFAITEPLRLRYEDSSDEPVVTALNKIANDRLDTDVPKDRWAHLRVTFNNNKRLFVNSTPVDSAEVYVIGKKRTEQVVTRKVYGYFSPSTERKQNTFVVQPDVGNSEIIRSSDRGEIHINLSNHRPPPNCFFHSVVVDMGYKCRTKMQFELGENFRISSVTYQLRVSPSERPLRYHDELAAKHAAEHGLTADEYARILRIMGRTPNPTELGIFSVMWSEHCSYKSSRKWLKRLPTEGQCVIQGPGENAGVVDIGGGLAAIFKIESHNHPSFIEPYQGAATGVGGIMRDVFTMGARPIANLNALRFGSPDDAKTRHLVAGVVAGIGGYGNCMGVPTVGGEVNFHPSYNGNCLVNAMTVGLAPADRIFYSRAAGVGNPVVYVGAKTGRDGIHGATMASAEFSEGTEEKRPTVQVGDPFTEKLLLEACLELMATDAIVSIQDMGAAGLTSSSVEMSSKGGLGIELDLDRVPCRETGMVPYEIMLSESQERMLMVIRPEAREQARAIFEKWELDFAEIGKLTDSGHLVLRWHGDVAADIPVEPLVAEAPVYDRPWIATPPRPSVDAPSVGGKADVGLALVKLMAAPDLASRRWIWEQYDHLVMGHTRQRPGGDAAVVRIPETNRALALTTDCTPRYCQADPQRGGAQAVAESWRNLTSVGAMPLAITDNMNFGNPERPEIMGQFVGCVEGMRDACLALDYPVVSGNVSFYNETNGRGIMPTPVVGGVGLIDDLQHVAFARFDRPNLDLVLVGETAGHLGSSLWLREIAGREEGAPPGVDLMAERRNGDFVRMAIRKLGVTACHDLSDGGLLVAAAEMALAGGLGATIRVPDGLGIAPVAWLFGEDQARYLMAAEPATLAEIRRCAAAEGVPIAPIGRTGGDALTVSGMAAISLQELRTAHEGWLPRYMSGGT